MKITDKQAEMLGKLYSYDQITSHWEGYFFESGDKADGRTLLSLCKRGFVHPSAYNMMPSVGHVQSPIFDERGVTELGRKVLKEYVSTVSPYGKPRWVKNVENAIDRESL